jgi:hypothetical protein
MKNNEAFDRCGWMYRSALLAILLSASIVQSQAQNYTLAARNSSLQVNIGTGGGLSDWTINGVNQLEQQWFYYSVGSGAVNSIDTIAPWSTPIVTTGNTSSLTETYANSTLSLTTGYTLQSQQTGSLLSKLGIAVTLVNLSSTSQTFHLFQYSDFWLGGVSGGQNVQFVGTASPYTVNQTSTSGGSLTGQIIATAAGAPAQVEEVAGIFDGNQFGLANGNAAPIFNDTVLSAGPGNVTYGYEINATLAAGSSLIVSEVQSVPEPSSLALITLGMTAMAFVCGRGFASQKGHKKA